MTAQPADELAAGSAGGDQLPVSLFVREQVIRTLRAALAQGRLTEDEHDARVAQASVSQSNAELAALTADIGPALLRAPPPRQPARPAEAQVDSSQNKVVNAGACVMLAILVLTTAFCAGNFGVFLAAVAAIAVALFVAGARMIYLRNEKHSRG